MQYESYERKVAKVASFLKWIFKHRLKILISLAVIVLATVAVIASKGSVISEEDCPVSIVYGEELGYSAKAFLSQTRYEYASQSGGGWSTEFPVAPGEYLVRAVADSATGVRYGRSRPFTLLARSITVEIADSRVTYGENPSVRADLAQGDTIECSDFIFNSDRTNAEANIGAISIKNNKGVDVTGSYTIETVDSDIVTVPRPITVTAQSLEKVYDGQPLVATVPDVSGVDLVGDDVITVIAEGSITSVGEVYTKLTCTVADSLGNDITHFYKITTVGGSLKVTKRPITLTSESYSAIYNGTVHSKEQANVTSGEVVTGETVTFGEWASLINAGKTDNIFAATVFGADGADVTSNYDVSYVFGEITVGKRPISVSTGSYSATYDGYYHAHESYTVYGDLPLVSGHSHSAGNWSSAIYAGEHSNSCTVSIYDTLSNTDVSANYDVSYSFGTISISKRSLSLSTPSESVIYSGANQILEMLDVTSGDLAYGDKIKVIGGTVAKNVGTYKNDIEFIIENGSDEDVTENYELDVTLGEITIIRRPITIKTGTSIFTYDGTDLTDQSYEILGEYGIASGDRVHILSSTTVKNVTDSVENKFTYIMESESGDDVTANYEITVIKGTLSVIPRDVYVEMYDAEDYYDGEEFFSDICGIDNIVLNHTFKIIKSTRAVLAGEYTNSIVEYDILDENGESVKSNYNLIETYGKLLIKKRPVTFVSASDSKIYDATPLTNNSWTISASTMFDLVAGHRLSAPSTTGSITNVGTTDNTYEGELKILDAAGNDLTANYEIKAELGKLTVEPRPITVTNANINGSITYTYDGKEKIFDSVSLTKGTLCTGHYISVSASAVYKNVVTAKEAKLGFDILDSDGESVAYNYDITESWGSVTINPRQITVSNNGISKSVEFTYDGKEYVYDSIKITDDSANGLCDGHYFEITSSAVFKNCVTKKQIKVGFEILDSDGAAVSGNYDITTIWSEITIHKRSLSVTNADVSGSVTMEYDGKEHAYDQIKITIGSLCEGHSIEVKTPTVFKDVVTSAEIVIRYEILDESGNDVTNNYDATDFWQKITITKRTVKVTNADVQLGSYVYDGKEHHYNQLAITSGSLCEGHYFDVTKYVILKDVVDSASLDMQFNICDEDGNNVTKNYAVSSTWQKASITPRYISVANAGLDSTNVSFVYDGKEHSYNEIAVTSGSLCDGHYFSIVKYKTLKDVIKDADVSITFEIRDEYGKNIGYNYVIEKETWSKVTITAREISIANNGIDKLETIVYDGKEHRYNSIAVTSGSLCDGHYFNITKYKTVKDVTPGADVSISYEIRDAQGKNVTSNYIVTEDWSTVVVTKRPITASTESYDEEYDGEWHVFDGVTVITGSLCDGHTFVVVVPVGGYDDADDIIVPDIGYPDVVTLESYRDVVTNFINYFDFKIIDENGKDVTENYDLTKQYGTINIRPRVIKVYTESNTWEYDGQTHSYPKYKVMDGYTIVEGHSMGITSAASITNPGSVSNVITFKILDGLTDVTYNYDVIIDSCGTLTVKSTDSPVDPIPPEEDPDNPGKPPIEEPKPDPKPPIDPENPPVNPGTGGIGEGSVSEPPDTYGIGLPPISDDFGGGAGGEPVIVFVVNSDTNGRIYLKQKSYGDYTGSGFKQAPLYEELMLDYLSAYYLASKAAENSGAEVATIVIDSKYGLYVLPYYSLETGNIPQTSDRYIEGTAGEPYTVYYMTSLEGAYLPYSAHTFEIMYSEFVHENYLGIGASTKSYLDTIIKENGFNKNDPDIIAKVAEYIQKSASYNLKYDRALDSSADIVVAFLDTYKEGVCQHYAAAATMLFRALGIPARYTVGYTTNTVAGRDVNVTTMDGHAWVEVYIDGIGWMQVEVTGSSADGPPEGGEDPAPLPDVEPELPQNIVLTPKKQTKVYDSTPLYAVNELVVDGALLELVELGYTYKVEIVGIQTDIGKGSSTITSFKLFDPDGNDVTSEFEFTYQKGVLEVVIKGVIDIYIYEKKFEYDGTRKGYASDEYVVVNAPDGVTLVMKAINISLTDVGSINSARITDNIYKYLEFEIYEDGVLADSKWYTVRVVDYASERDYSMLTITRRSIVITTASASKPYDGEELTNPVAYVSLGMLGEGHTLYLEVLGSITTVGSVQNTVNKESLKILDSEGNDVTKNYYIPNSNWILGILTIT